MPTRSTAARVRTRRPAPPRPRARAEITAVVDAVRRLVRGLRLAEQRTRLEAGVSAAQLFVLSQLAESEATSLSELAERTMTDRSSVAAVVERLESEGLVAAERSSADRRRVAVRITAAGARRLRAAPPAPTELLVVALESLPMTERRALGTHLGRLVDAMGLADGPAPMLFEERPAGVDAEARR